MIVKVLAVENDRVSIGLQNGSMKYVDARSFSTRPVPGKEYEGFQDQGGRMLFVPYVDQAKQGMYGGDSCVNKMTYCLLAIFLGGFGAHKFYAGKKGMGVLYLFLLFFGGLSMFIGIVEGLFALSKKPDEHGNIRV